MLDRQPEPLCLLHFWPKTTASFAGDRIQDLVLHLACRTCMFPNPLLGACGLQAAAAVAGNQPCSSCTWACRMCFSTVLMNYHTRPVDVISDTAHKSTRSTRRASGTSTTAAACCSVSKAYHGYFFVRHVSVSGEASYMQGGVLLHSNQHHSQVGRGQHCRRCMFRRCC